jgi:hypothetical protein
VNHPAGSKQNPLNHLVGLCLDVEPCSRRETSYSTHRNPPPLTQLHAAIPASLCAFDACATFSFIYKESDDIDVVSRRIKSDCGGADLGRGLFDVHQRSEYVSGRRDAAVFSFAVGMRNVSGIRA